MWYILKLYHTEKGILLSSKLTKISAFHSHQTDVEDMPIVKPMSKKERWGCTNKETNQSPSVARVVV